MADTDTEATQLRLKTALKQAVMGGKLASEALKDYEYTNAIVHTRSTVYWIEAVLTSLKKLKRDCISDEERSGYLFLAVLTQGAIEGLTEIIHGLRDEQDTLEQLEQYQ